MIYKQGMRVILLVVLLLLLAACNLGQQELPIDAQQPDNQQTTETPEPTETLPPFTPLASLTPSQTLRPPPTFEPPTLTPTATDPATVTPAPTINLEVNIPGLQGLNTATPEPGQETCEPRDDWGLEYEVQPGDALANIAPRYNTYANDLAAGNCIDDPSLIRVGQRIRVPGEAHPSSPEFVCSPWELLTPFNGTITIEGNGTITFNWRGPDAPRYLVRLWYNADASGSMYDEYLVEFRNDYTLDLAEIPGGGTYSWRVYPLGRDFLQIPCVESHHSIFTKAAAPPTLTP